MSMRRVPSTVIRAFSDGIKLKQLGLNGPGLQPATYDEAIKIVRTGTMSEGKFSRMRAWLARHGASTTEAAALAEQMDLWKRGELNRKAPALVAWLLWGGDAAVEWIRQSEPGFLTRTNPSTQMKMVLSGSAPNTVRGKYSLIKCENGSTSDCDLISHGPSRDIAIELLQNPEFDHGSGDLCIVTDSAGAPELIAISNGRKFDIVSDGCVGGSLVARWEGPSAKADDMMKIALRCGLRTKTIGQCCSDLVSAAMRRNVGGKKIDHPIILEAAKVCAAYADNPSPAYRVPLSEHARRLHEASRRFSGDELGSCDLVMTLCLLLTKPGQLYEAIAGDDIPTRAAELKKWHSGKSRIDDGLFELAAVVRRRLPLSELIQNGIANGKIRTVG